MKKIKFKRHSQKLEVAGHFNTGQELAINIFQHDRNIAGFHLTEFQTKKLIHHLIDVIEEREERQKQ